MSGDCIGPRHRLLLAAMVPYIERDERVDYEAVAAALNVKIGSIKSMVSQMLRYNVLFRAGSCHDRLFALKPVPTTARPTKRAKVATPASGADRPSVAPSRAPFITPPSKERLMGRRA